MGNFTKKLLLLSYILTFIIAPHQMVLAFEPVIENISDDSEVEFVPCPDAEMFSPARRDLSVVINGEKTLLACEFTDMEGALNTFKSMIPNLLSFVAEKYNLDELNNGNWKLYEAKIRNLRWEEYPDSSERRLSEIFFDIYENKELNDNTRRFVESRNNTFGVDELFEIVPMLPNYSSIVKRFNKQRLLVSELESFQSRGYIAYWGIQYATSYAYSPNVPAYEDLGNYDCTNFVSQVLHHGGLPQTPVRWYHYKVGNNHFRSASWVNANNFASYMGVFRTFTNNHYEFSRHLFAGDIILVDGDMDGYWDHAGAVTQTSQYAGTYNDGTYFDYRVAQHSPGYNLLASDNGNNWPGPNKKFGIVRK